MATPSTYVNYPLNQSIVRYVKGNSFNTVQTGSMMDLFKRDLRQDNTVQNLYHFFINNEFIRFEESFKAQFVKLNQYMGDLTFEKAKQKFSLSISDLIDFNLDVLTMELTFDKSIFYTFKKDGYTFFLQHFLDNISEEVDEAVLSIFKNDEKLPSYAGTLNDTISEISSILSPERKIKEELLFS